MSWAGVLVGFFIGGFIGFMVAAALCAGARQEAEREAAYWRVQADVYRMMVNEVVSRAEKQVAEITRKAARLDQRSKRPEGV